MTSQNFPRTDSDRASIYRDMWSTMTYAQLVESSKGVFEAYDAAIAARLSFLQFLVKQGENGGHASDEDIAQVAHLDAICAAQSLMAQGISDEISARVRAGNFQ